MKKQRMIGVAIAIVILLAGSYGALRWYEYSKTEIFETVETVLCNINADEIERIELKLEDTTVYIKEQGEWIQEDKPDLAYDQDLLGALIQDFAQSVSTEKISNVQEMSTYGIDETSPMITLYGAGEKVQTFKIGKDVLGKDATYISDVLNDEEVYVLDNAKLGIIRRDARGFIKKSLDFSELSDLKSLEITQKDNAVLTITQNPSKGSEGYEKWILTGPFQSSHQMSTDYMDQMIEWVKAFTKDYYVAEKNDQTLDQYGFNAPTLKLVFNEKEEVLFGKEENNFTYFVLSNDPYIYKMPTSKIKGFTSINPFDLIRKQIYVPNISELQEVEVTYGEETIAIKWMSDETNPEQIATYINDQPVSEEVAKSLVEEIAALNIQSKLVNAQLEQNQDREAEATIRYIFKNRAVKTIELRPFDPSFYVLKDNGIIEFVVEKKQFITIWNKLQKAKEIS